MHAPARIAVDTNRPSAALGRFPPDRAMIIDGREVKGRGKTIERSSPAHGVVTRVPRGTAEDARAISTSVWSRDVDTEIGVRRGVRAGTVWIDTSSTERRSCRLATIISRESAAN